MITVEPPTGSQPTTAAKTEPVPASSNGTPVFSAFAGLVEVVDIMVAVGESVSKGQKIAAVEAMKARHDIQAPCDGRVSSLNVKIGDEIDSSKPLLTIS